MGEVKTPGQVLREALGSPTMFLYRHTCPITGLQYLSPKTRINGFASDEAVGAFVLASADADAAAQAVLAADPVRTQALDLVESLADALGTHLTTRPDEDLIDEAREFVCKAREASKL